MDIEQINTSCQSSSSTSSTIEVKITTEDDSTENNSSSTNSELNNVNSFNLITSSSIYSKSHNRLCVKNSIATSTTTLNQLISVESSSSQCVTSCPCHPSNNKTYDVVKDTPSHYDEDEDTDEDEDDDDDQDTDPFDNERINVMREIITKCLTVDIPKRPSAGEICERLAKLI